jgi:hypothetical protein
MFVLIIFNMLSFLKNNIKFIKLTKSIYYEKF